MKVTVAGTGYFSSVTAVCMAEKGHGVLCVDIDEDKITTIKSGIALIENIGVGTLPW